MRANFIGEHAATLDAKNRVFIPARFRAELAKEGHKSFIVTLGEENLWMFLPSEWESALGRITKPVTKRFLMSKAQELEVDGQGRVLLPSGLVGEAGLQKDVLIVGVGTKFELWDTKKRAAWEKKNLAEIKEGLKDLDI